MKQLCAYAAFTIGAVLASAAVGSTEGFVVKGASMEPNISAGQKVGCAHANSFTSGDVIIYRHPKRANSMSIKTIVAVAGQSVEMKFGKLSIDGRVLKRAVSAIGQVRETLAGGREIDTIPASASSLDSNTPKVIVPDLHVYVLGNNRNQSIDSRSAQLHGTVPVRNIICRAKLPTKRG